MNNSVKEIIQAILKSANSNEKEDRESVIKSLSAVSKSAAICKNYSEISNKIYSLDESEFEALKKIIGLEGNEDELSPLIESVNNIDEKRRDNLSHFWQHISLSCLQRNYADVITKNIKKEAIELQEKVNDTTTKIRKVYVNC